MNQEKEGSQFPLTPSTDDKTEINPPAPFSSEIEGLNKVRDILFGNQVRNIETQFSLLKESVNEENRRLLEETQKNFSSLENYIKGEFEKLSSQISDHVKKEIESFSKKFETEKDAVKELSAKMDRIGNIEEKFNELNEEAKKNQDALKEELNKKSQKISEELQLKIQDLSESLKAEYETLLKNKADRSELVSIFKDMAEKFAANFDISE
jgi:DNA repair ATPase RecN